MSEIAEKYDIDLYKQGKCQCPRCAAKGGDTSKDNLMVYGVDKEGRHKGAYCWSCTFTIPSEEWLEENGETEKEINLVGSVFNEDIHKQLKSITTTNSMGFRGIRAETCAYFGVRHEYDPTTGVLVAQYYPTTINNQLSGYKRRELPKKFSAIGETGKECEMFGQFRFKNSNSKKVIIVGGEIDQLSAFQMIDDYNNQRAQKATGDADAKSEYERTPVVSSTLGESGTPKQIASQYEWFNNFDEIVICMDNDEAGQAAADACAKMLPKGKVLIMKMVLKDPNEYLKNGRQKEFVSAMYSARPWTPNGIVGSSGLMDRMKEAVMVPKIPLPPFMHKAQKMMAGGIPLKRIVNMASASGTGKSTIVDEMNYFWIFHSPHRVGIVSLESDVDEYGIKLTSRHMGFKIDLLETPEEKLAFLNRPDVDEAAHHLFYNGQEDRFHLMDERDGGLDDLKDKIMRLIVECGCLVIVLDPLQDILDGMSNEDQAVFMRWQKGLTKSHGVTFININHVRKSGGGQTANSAGGEMFEEDIQGSSSIFKSGACNLVFRRNKEALSPILRNITYMKMTKCRWTGATGAAGEYFYDNATHTMWDLWDYLEAHPDVKEQYFIDLQEEEERKKEERKNKK